MKRTVTLIFVLFNLAGCTTLSPPRALSLTAEQMRYEYVGREFETKDGDRIRFQRDYTYVLSDGSTGTYEFTERNTIKFVGGKDGYFTYPDGYKVGRPDIGLEFFVSKEGAVYTHTLVGGLRTGNYTRVDQAALPTGFRSFLPFSPDRI